MTAATATATHVRGVIVGLFTGALAMAAHGFADHMVPSGGMLALLAVISAAFGAAVTTWQQTAQPHVLIGVLALGQLVGHLALSAGGAMPGTQSAPLMLAAHLAAVLAAAVLVTTAERLYLTLSSVIGRCTTVPTAPTAPSAPAGAVRSDPPQQRVLLMAASISHRGPPVSAVR